MKRSNRILVVLLSLVITLTYMPAIAFAEGEDADALTFTFHWKKSSAETIDDIASLQLFTNQSTNKSGQNNIVYYTYSPDDGTTKTVKWTTSDNTIVKFGSKDTVTTTGKQTGTMGTPTSRSAQIKGLKAGEADVTISCGEATKILHVTVTDPVDPETATLEDIPDMRVGQKLTISPIVTPTNADYNPLSTVWTSTNTDVAFITGGKITAKAEGTTQISCQVKTYGGQIIQSNTVTLTILPAMKPIHIGETGYDTLAEAIEAATNEDTIQIEEQNINIDEPIAVSKNGKITVAGIGTTTINGNAFTVSGGSTKLVLNNINLNNANGNVMTISDGAIVTLNDDVVNGNAHLNGGAISLGAVKEFNGNVTADGTEEVEIVRGDFGDVTYKKGSNRALLSVNNPINGTVFGNVSADMKIIKVTFTVENGAWNDGTTENKYVTLSGVSDDELKLDASDIPAVGGKPDEGYVEGAWDIMPSADTALTKDTTYKYSYVDELVAAKEDANAKLNDVDTSKYSGAEKTAVEKAIADARTAIEAAQTVEEVEAAMSAATGIIDKQKTDLEKSADKEAAEKKASALEKASNINKAAVTATDIRKASELGATTVTLGKKVKKINRNAFKGTNIRTVIVKTKKLKKAKVKNAFKGAKVTKVKVNVGSKKLNKKYVKKYKKIFTKKNVGKKVKVSA